MNHGFGYDDNDNEEVSVFDNQNTNKVRKINKMPFKVLDAP